MVIEFRGVIEGFYGRPWSTTQRFEEQCQQQQMHDFCFQIIDDDFLSLCNSSVRNCLNVCANGD
jgi:hypothetical protein